MEKDVHKPGFDTPVERPSGDLLGMNRHAEALAKYIIAHKDSLPFTVGILGEWGEGKTSFVNLLCYHLSNPGGVKNERGIKFISFSAWQHNTTEKLWRALILRIARVLYEKEESGCVPPAAVSDAQRVAVAPPPQAGAVADAQKRDANGSDGGGFLHNVSRFLTGDAFLLRSPPPERYDQIVEELEGAEFGQVRRRGSGAVKDEATMAALVNVAVAALGTVSPLVGWARGLFGLDTKENVAKTLTGDEARGSVDALRSFREIFGAIVEECMPEGEPLYIFIDDLDRAQPDVALDIMEAIRVVFEQESRCVFIVAVDHRLISQGLRLRYPELFDPKHGGTLSTKGDEYLEKIIQFRMFMPQRTQEQVQKMIAGRYPELMAAGDIIRSVVGTNPRRIKQHCENLIFQRMVAEDDLAHGENAPQPAAAQPAQADGAGDAQPQPAEALAEVADTAHGYIHTALNAFRSLRRRFDERRSRKKERR